MDSVFLVVALGAVVAGFVQGLSGFAFGMVAMSFWAWALEPRLAATLAVFGALTGQILAAISVRRGLSLQLPVDKRTAVTISYTDGLLPMVRLPSYRALLVFIACFGAAAAASGNFVALNILRLGGAAADQARGGGGVNVAPASTAAGLQAQRVSKWFGEVIAVNDCTLALGPGVTIHFNFFQKPGVGLKAAWRAVRVAYVALFEGSIGNPKEMVQAVAAWTRGDPS